MCYIDWMTFWTSAIALATIGLIIVAGIQAYWLRRTVRITQQIAADDRIKIRASLLIELEETGFVEEIPTIEGGSLFILRGWIKNIGGTRAESVGFHAFPYIEDTLKEVHYPTIGTKGWLAISAGDKGICTRAVGPISRDVVDAIKNPQSGKSLFFIGAVWGKDVWGGPLIPIKFGWRIVWYLGRDKEPIYLSTIPTQFS